MFLSRAADGTWHTPASFMFIAAAAHAGGPFEVQSRSTALRANSKPDLFVGLSKHGNFVDYSKCAPDWLNLCVTSISLFSEQYKLFNVGEHLARFIDNLKGVQSWNGQYAWSCQGFLGGPAQVLNDLYLAPFHYPGEFFWDDGDIVPNTSQVVIPRLCGS